MNQRSLDGFPRKVVSLLLAFGIVSASLPASAGFWGRDDSDSYQRDNYQYNNRQSNYQPAYKPPDIKIAAPKVDFKPVNQEFYKIPEGKLTDDDRQMIRAGNALNPPKVPDSYLNGVKAPVLTNQTKPVTTPLTLQFKPADVKTPKAQEIKQTVLKDPSATAVKQPLVGGFQKVLQTIGTAIMAVGTKIVQAVQAVAHFFRGNPSTAPSALAKQVSQQYTHLNEIKPGVFQTTNEGQTYAHGHSWEPGSTFKATPNGLQVIHGTAMEDSFSSLRRVDGKTMPVIMNGNANGGVEPVGVDFARMTPGTSFKSSSPVDIPKVGTIQADQITYSGQKNGDPILEVHGKGALSVESISDPKIIKQATDQLSIRLRLMNDSFQVKDAVLTVGEEKSYLDAQGKATPVNEIAKSVNSTAGETAPLLKQAEQLDTQMKQYASSVNSRLASVHKETGQVLTEKVQPTDTLPRYRQALGVMKSEGDALQRAVNEEDYGAALSGQPALQAKISAAKAGLSGLQEEVSKWKSLDTNLRTLSADLGAFSLNLDMKYVKSPGAATEKDVKTWGQTNELGKASIGDDIHYVLRDVLELTKGGSISRDTAATWGRGLLEANFKVMSAPPGSSLERAKVLPITELQRQTFDKFFDQRIAKHPGDAAWAAKVGGEKAAVATTAKAGILVAGIAFLWEAPVVAIATAGAGWALEKGFRAVGANNEQATALAFVASAPIAAEMGNSEYIRGKEFQFKTGLVSWVKAKWESLVSSENSTVARTVGGESGFIRVPGETPAGGSIRTRAGRDTGPFLEETGQTLGVTESGEGLATLQTKPVDPKLFEGLGDAKSSPWLSDGRIGVRTHIEEFRDGGSFLMRASVYERYIKSGKALGRQDGLFITTKSALDELLTKANGDVNIIKKGLGIPLDQWNEPLVRVDVLNPLLHDARFPSGFESGANPLFKWGGYTKGGIPEVSINPVGPRDYVATKVFLRNQQ